MTTKLIINKLGDNNTAKIAQLECKTDDIKTIRPRSDGSVKLWGYVNVSDILKIRDYLNENYPVDDYGKTDSQSPEETYEPGVYATQSGRFVFHSTEVMFPWMYLNKEGNYTVTSFDVMVDELGYSEFPLRKAKLVVE